MIQIPDVEEAMTLLYEEFFAVVDNWDVPKTIFGEDGDVGDEVLHDAEEAWIFAMIITDNDAISGCGSEDELAIVREKRDQAFVVIEKIRSLMNREDN